MKRSRRAVLCRWLVLLALLPVCGPVLAAQAQTASGDARLNELFYQLQLLQQEVRELRGLVEEQAYQLNRLARDQKEQYIDLDRRVAELSRGGATGALTPPGPVPAPSGTAAVGASSGPPAAASTPVTGPVRAGVAPTAAEAAAASASTPQPVPRPAPGVTEREAYQAAFDLMKNRRFEESIAAFNRLLVDYPDGQYTPNAYYWLGELHLAQQDLERARQSFMQVINLYPDHPKVPDTLYKLGVVYHRLGDLDRAMEFFDRVRREHPQSSAAGLAASYQQELR